MTATVLLTGASGLLGSALLQTAPANLHILAQYNTHPITSVRGTKTTKQCDLTDLDALGALFHNDTINLVINCAGAVNVDRCETDQHYAISGNVQVVRNLQVMSIKSPFRLIHFSTDYVFSGEKGPSSEADLPNPINFYGKSKLSAEQLITASSLDSTIIRICALYSMDLSAPDNPYSKIVHCLQRGQTYPAAIDLMNNPTEVAELAAAVWEIALRTDVPKLLHLASPEYISRYDFACHIAEAQGLNSDLILKIDSETMTLPARRPKFAGVASLHADGLLRRKLKSFNELYSH
jgi:dTDP-4-dehydrorhamnose reductase